MQHRGAGLKVPAGLTARVGDRGAVVVRQELVRPAVHPRLAAVTAVPLGVAR